MVTNSEIAKLLRSVAAAYTLSNENRFKIIAYEKAADTVEHLNRELYDIWQNNELETISGIGKNIAKHLDQYFKNPKKNYLFHAINQYNLSIYELLEIPGIGVKKAAKLTAELQLNKPSTVVDDLFEAANSNKIRIIEGFGEKSEIEIIEAIKIYQHNIKKPKRMLLSIAGNLANQVVSYLKQVPE